MLSSEAERAADKMDSHRLVQAEENAKSVSSNPEFVKPKHKIPEGKAERTRGIHYPFYVISNAPVPEMLKVSIKIKLILLKH